MALIARRRTGRGQRIEVPLFDAMFELIGANGISVDGEFRVARSRGTTTYECADGRRILFNSSSSPRFWRWFCQAAGLSANAHAVDLVELFRTRSAQEWEERINSAGGPTTRIRSAAEWLASDHARVRGTVVCVEDPELGPTWMPGVNVHLSETPGDVRRPRHRVDGDRADVLAELEQAVGPRFEVSQLAINAALEGVSVLDLTQVVAGPCTGRILVEYGADVIKINNPRPESLTSAVSLSGRPTDPGNQQHEHLNRGKQTLLLDLHTPGGRRVLWQLIDRADVLMQNYARGMAEEYGIGYDQVHARRPDLLYFSLSAYGYGGPMGHYRGYEGNAQAATGLMDRFGGDGLPQGQPYLLDDYGTGIRGAFAIALGLYARQASGRGQHVNISLVETASYHQAPFLLDYVGKKWNEPRGVDALGSSPLHRLYPASDGWLFFGAGADGLDRLAGVEGLDNVEPERLETRFAAAPVAVWVERLRAVGIGAHRLVSVEELMDDAWVREHGLSLMQHVEGVGAMTMPGVAARLSLTPLRVGAPVRPPGADAPAVLARIGLADELDQLIAEGAIKT
jgi:crotonobetainyl-CoA:carnitine CoA-transferase CaiB-like acyl-CoA transferase